MRVVRVELVEPESFALVLVDDPLLDELVEVFLDGLVWLVVVLFEFLECDGSCRCLGEQSQISKFFYHKVRKITKLFKYYA